MPPIVDTVFSCKVESSASCHEPPSFLRNKRDAFPSSLHTLHVLSSNVKFNWGLIINTPHALVLLIYANLFQGFLFVIFSKWIFSSSPTGSRPKGEKNRLSHESQNTQSGRRVITIAPWLPI